MEGFVSCDDFEVRTASELGADFGNFSLTESVACHCGLMSKEKVSPHIIYLWTYRIIVQRFMSVLAD